MAVVTSDIDLSNGTQLSDIKWATTLNHIRPDSIVYYTYEDSEMWIVWEAKKTLLKRNEKKSC